MVAVSPDVLIWAIILAIGVGTFALRFSFLGLSAYVSEIPPGLERALRYVPAAVIAAIVLPAIVVVDGSVSVVGNDRVLAGAVAAVVAWRTEDILATIVVGIGVLLLLGQLL